MPVIVLAAENKINQQYRDRGTRQDHDGVTQEEKSKHVIDPASPHIAHDEVKLDRNSSKWKDSRKGHGLYRTQVTDAWRDLPRNLIHTDRRLDRLRKLVIQCLKQTYIKAYIVFESSPTTCKAQRQTDKKPDSDNHQHCTERDRTT